MGGGGGDRLADRGDADQIAAVQPDRDPVRGAARQVGLEPRGQDDDPVHHAAPHQPARLGGRGDDSRDFERVGRVQVFHQGPGQGGLRLRDHGDRQSHRRLPGVGGRVVECVEDHGQDQQAGHRPGVWKVPEGRYEGGPDAMFRQWKGQGLGLRRPSAAQADHHCRQGQGDHGRDREDRQVAPGAAGIRPGDHLAGLKAQIVGVGQDIAPDPGEARSVIQRQGAVREGDGRARVDGGARERQIDVAEQGDQQG